MEQKKQREKILNFYNYLSILMLFVWDNENKNAGDEKNPPSAFFLSE